LTRLRPEGTHGGDRVALLSQDQVSLLERNSQRFYRRATWVTASSGIGHAGDFTVGFDPAFQHVLLHGVWVERDQRREDRLTSARIEVLRRESGLESGLLDGQLSLHLVLDDIRVGDVVDFAVTVVGDNPALEGAYRNHQWFAPELPTRLREIRVLRPHLRELSVRTAGEGIEYARQERDDRIDERWTLRDLAPARSEDRVPAWHFSGPELEIADRTSWGEVVEWALPIYADRDSDSVRELAGELGLAAGAANEDSILRAIRFVSFSYCGALASAKAEKAYGVASRNSNDVSFMRLYGSSSEAAHRVFCDPCGELSLR
jgi:hypothetical protein